MIIKNISKIFKNTLLSPASNRLIQPNNTELSSLLLQNPKYLLSRKKPSSSPSKANAQPKPRPKKTLRAQNITQSFIRGEGLRRHLVNGPLIRRLYQLSKINNYVNIMRSKYGDKVRNGKKKGFSIQQDMNLNFKGSGLVSFLFWSFAIFFFLKLFTGKSQKGNQIVKSQSPKSQNPAQILQLSSQKLQQFICKLKKIHITTIQRGGKRKSAHEDQQHQGQQPPTNKTQKPPSRKIMFYKVVMEDRDGNQHIADPYMGDPNHLLKYIEDVQQKYHVTDRADVFENNKVEFGFNEALKQAAQYVSPFFPVFITLYIFRRMDPSSILKNFSRTTKQFKIQAINDIKTKFKDVAGMQQAKKQIVQFVDFLKNNQKYREMGAKIPKGALLTGPPGTGKTMLARACAGEAGVSFFYISGSQFVEVFVGLGASKVRDLFAKARQSAPSIVFIDQIDAIGKKRQNSRNQQKDTTLNQLLVQMDGFSSSQTIVVLAATNRKQTLDNALTRPGRFDRMVQITLPDVKARQQIFMVHLSPLKIDPSVEMRTIAKRLSQLSPGFSGADIANLCNQAAIIATRKNRNFIIDKDFQEATQRITAGYVKKNLMKQKTKKRVAYHEAGHAVASWFLKGGDPLVKLTIIPRSKGALGYAQYLPKTTYIMSRQQLIDKVSIMLGGITTQQIFFGEMSSGGSDDLQKVYGLTRRMITQFGMGKQTYNITIDEESYIQKQSTYLTDKMQEEINMVLQEARRRARETIEAKREIIQLLAKELMEKETLNSQEILKIMGQRPDFKVVKKQIQKEIQKKEKAQSVIKVA